jgi:hypothetical protein
MNQKTISGLACTLILSLVPLTIHAQDKTDTATTTSRKKADRVALIGFKVQQNQNKKGPIKFFNETKGFGFIINVTGMDEWIEGVATICGGPTGGCTFEIMDILSEVLSGSYGGSDSTSWNTPFRGGLAGLMDEIKEGDKVNDNLDGDQNDSGDSKKSIKSKVKFKAGSDLAGRVN